MRKHSSRIAAVAILGLVLLAAAADTIVVKIQTSAIRQSPQFFAPVVATVKAGDKLIKVAESNGWIQVKTAAGASGWIHSGAVETPKINLLASNSSMKTQASSSEVALAGKGFNKQVEDSYKAKNPQLNFAAVDRMLQVKATSTQIESFLRGGQLNPFGGAK
jgi:uncharacterized protein YgiM (DUF1202 family)